MQRYGPAEPHGSRNGEDTVAPKVSVKGLITAVVVGLATGSFTTAAAAGNGNDVDEAFDRLRTIPARFGILGTVCEYLAKDRIAQRFPASRFEVRVGIVYSEEGGRTLGELDVVVFRTSDDEAVWVGEVKCRRDFPDALRHAHEQLHRFQNHVRRGTPMTLAWTRDRSVTFERSQFDEAPALRTVSQKGGGPAGFDRTLELDRDQVDRLQDRLVACQDAGRCPRP